MRATSVFGLAIGILFAPPAAQGFGPETIWNSRPPIESGRRAIPLLPAPAGDAAAADPAAKPTPLPTLGSTQIKLPDTFDGLLAAYGPGGQAISPDPRERSVVKPLSPQPDVPLKAPTDGVKFSVRVPEGAAVWVNGRATQSSGAQRVYTCSGLSPGDYDFTVRVEYDHDGWRLSQTKQLQLSPGQAARLVFDLPPRPDGPTAE